MTATVAWVQAFLIEIERILPDGGTRHMSSTTRREEREIRIGYSDWYQIVEEVIIVEVLVRQPAMLRWHRAEID